MIARTQDDIDILREGGKRLARHLQALAAMVKPGVATDVIEMKARELIKADGDTPSLLGYKPYGARRAYPAATCISINEEVVHKIPIEDVRTIADGDIVSIDMTLTHKGLMTDATVTVIAGTADPADERLLSATKEAIALGIAQARVGNTTGDIGHAVEQVARKYGCGFPRELAGHGVGRAVHEEPYVPNFGTPGAGDHLKEGQVIAIEPMFTRGRGEVKLERDGYTYSTKDGSRAAHVEHTVLITKDGPEILTTL
jgi:methionyl aminopeptidase